MLSEAKAQRCTAMDRGGTARQGTAQTGKDTLRKSEA